MEKLLLELAAEVPGLVVVVIIILKFLKTNKEISDECHRHQRESTEALKENTKMLGRVAECLRSIK